MTHDETTHGSSEERDERHSATGGAGKIDDGDISALEAELIDRHQPYAKATVVRREPPASANVGDRAVVTADGELHGWVGGAACAQSIVTMQGQEAIESGTPQLIGIAPDPETVDRPGLEAFPMTCHSDGVLELFVEPVSPTTELVIVGDSPVARSLARLAGELAVDVTLVVTDTDSAPDVAENVAIVAETDPRTVADQLGPAPLVAVASMGKYDARGLAIGALAGAPYVGLIASDERASEEIDRAAGLIEGDPEAVEAVVTNPAGVDIAAHTPAEIAVSLLAEIVDVRAETTAGVDEVTSSDADAVDSETPDEDATDDSAAVDPVCGMTVDPAEAAATAEHDGETYYFCCHGCADSFENDPGSYLEGVEGHA
jgi:xanthine dehydrogenase accessory factor